MKNRGKVNIDTADYLYNNRQTFINCINKFNNDDINHIIIGRWYYGVFLLAKDYLISKGYSQHCNKDFRGQPCTIKNCTLQCLAHKGNRYSIWSVLVTYAKKNKALATNGTQLAQLREKYEYSAELCGINELKNAKRYFENIKSIIEKLRCIK
ncbi:hypothetical protein [Brachyspira hyodysenteriae]|uniref:hypothetical protein n=1 Tax=Brachyspira hyodysenteriae TaxID=159 RepID=UPI00063D9BB1|nr:hypothetical protein [Brachyspira hyodysenteriae]KLI13517.1 hypothetical protein SU45_13455 [Brachyspira hyodysenteriae]KLI59447.1 hypothetical protein SZ46_08835 [Brachyspira hyodysenteriae]